MHEVLRGCCMDEIIHIITCKKVQQILGPNSVDSRHAIKYYCTCLQKKLHNIFCPAPHFTGAIKELRAIKDGLSLSYPEQSINLQDYKILKLHYETFCSPYLFT
jgi:hypothetical protein